MNTILLNSFSLSIFTRQEGREFYGGDYTAYHMRAAAAAVLQFIPITTATAKECLYMSDKIDSFIGHADTAAMVGVDLELPLVPNMEKYVFSQSDTIIVAQYTGPRLPEGCKSLPEGSKLDYWLVVSDYHRD